MTDDLTRAEEQLRALLTTRAADIPPRDLSDGVVRRARRRRFAVVAAAATAVAVVAAGLPTALAAVRSDAAPAAGPNPTAGADAARYRCARAETPSAAVPGLPAQRDVAGSLGGDPAAVAAVARAGWAALSQEAHGALDPALTRVQAAHRADDGWIVGVATGHDRTGRLVADAAVVGPDLDHLSGRSDGWQEGTERTTQRFKNGEAYAAVVECGPLRALAIVPPGGTAEATWTAGIAADGTVQQETPALPTRPDGLATAVLTAPPTAAVSVLAYGGGAGASDALIPAGLPKGPSRAEMAAKLRSAPGNLADRRTTVGLVDQANRVFVPVRQRDARVLWAGQGAGRVQVVAAVSTLPSGAQLLWGNAVTWDGGQSGGRLFDGVIAAGALDRTAYRVPLGEREGRPQGIFFTGTRRVDVTTGGRTRTETVTGGLMVDAAATVVVRGPGGAALPLVDVFTDLTRVPFPQF